MIIKLIHGDNIKDKISKGKNPKNRILLIKIRSKYKHWNNENMKITGITKKDIGKKVKLLNNYKHFIEDAIYKKEKGRSQGFTSQSKLHSTVIEEFMYYLFKNIPKLSNKHLYWGPKGAYTNLYFSPVNIDKFERDSSIIINVKNQDFSISKEIILKSKVSNSDNWIEKELYVPIVSIECKTYLDKTMYEGSVSTAERIKKGNPYCIFLIATETYDVGKDVDPKYSSIDQIYILRKVNNKNNPIDENVVWDLFMFVKKHIDSDWYNVEENIKKGRLI